MTRPAKLAQRLAQPRTVDLVRAHDSDDGSGGLPSALLARRGEEADGLQNAEGHWMRRLGVALLGALLLFLGGLPFPRY